MTPSPRHHPPDDLLAAYAAGVSPEAVSLVAACHLKTCPACRGRAAALESIGGALLQDAPSVDLAAGALDAVLARLDDPVPPPAPRAPLPGFLAGRPWPRPLHAYLSGADRWQRRVPGVRQLGLPLDLDGTPVTLVEMRAGFTVPPHGHAGLELNLVLEGGFDDDHDGAVYLPGDLSVKAPDVEHRIHAHPDGPCVVLVVRGGRLVPKDLMGRLGALLGGF